MSNIEEERVTMLNQNIKVGEMLTLHIQTTKVGKSKNPGATKEWTKSSKNVLLRLDHKLGCNFPK